MSKKRQQMEEPQSEKVVLSGRLWHDYNKEAEHVNEQKLKKEAEIIVVKEISKTKQQILQDELDKKQDELDKKEEEIKLLKMKNESFKSTKVDTKPSIFDEKENKKLLDKFVNEIRKEALIELESWSKSRKK